MHFRLYYASIIIYILPKKKVYKQRKSSSSAIGYVRAVSNGLLYVITTTKYIQNEQKKNTKASRYSLVSQARPRRRPWPTPTPSDNGRPSRKHECIRHRAALRRPRYQRGDGRRMSMALLPASTCIGVNFRRTRSPSRRTGCRRRGNGLAEPRISRRPVRPRDVHLLPALVLLGRLQLKLGSGGGHDPPVVSASAELVLPAGAGGGARAVVAVSRVRVREGVFEVVNVVFGSPGGGFGYAQTHHDGAVSAGKSIPVRERAVSVWVREVRRELKCAGAFEFDGEEAVETAGC
jgi:hypothetical protein